MDGVQAPLVPILGDWIAQVPGTISLGQGVVHYPPPPEALEAVRAGLGDPSVHTYQPEEGIPSLRNALAAKLRDENAIDVGRDTGLMVTAGGNLAFLYAVLATTEPGDEIILPAPFYFNHEMTIQAAGCRAVPVATDAACQLRVDAIRAAITGRTRAVVTISPNNPTGAVYPERALREVSALCAERSLYHISDEVYEYFTVRNGAPRLARGVRGRRGPHDYDQLAVEGVRLCRLASGLLCVSRAPGRGHAEGAGHDPDLRDGHLAGRGGRGPARRRGVQRRLPRGSGGGAAPRYWTRSPRSAIW